jgi:hypothetical protein
MNPARNNMWIAGVAAGVCLALIVTIAALSGRSETDTFRKRPSTFFTDPSGTRGIFLVLQRVVPSVEQWRLPLTELETAPVPSSLIAMGPGALGQAEAKALDSWLARGGQLIVAASPDWFIQGAAKGQPSGFLAAHGISPAKDGRPPIQAAVFKEVGRGRIIYVPDNYTFSNSNIAKTDNAVWLAERCGEWGGGVRFDEYHLGFNEERGLISLVGAFLVTPWGLVCAQLGLAGLVYLAGCKRRFGRPLEEMTVERTNPLETAQALGGLFKSAQARALGARMIQQHVNSYVSSVLGYRVDLMDPETRERLAGPLRIEKTDLDSYAKAAQSATSAQPVTDAELIQFGQKATAISRSFHHGAARGRRANAAG